MMARPQIVCAMLLVVTAVGAAQLSAQSEQTTPPPGAAPGRGSGGSTRGTQPAPAAGERAPLPLGFSVVLVLGDIQAGSVQDDVPPAARKALVDMKDFLPFKSYRLLDAAWVLCCGQDHRTLTFMERNLVSGFGTSTSTVTTQLRGPESKEYDLKLSASRAEGSRTFVRFSLTETADSAEAEEAATMADANRRKELNDLQARAEALEKQARSKREAGLVYQNIEAELAGVRARITDLTTRAALETTRRAYTHASNRVVIDTSFTMDLGETVVVGTSRLKAGSRALIALLTAVPPKSSARPPEETR